MTDRIGYKKAVGVEAEKRRPGRPTGARPNKSELQRLYVKESKSIREIAGILGCSKDLIYRSLEEFGIKRRSHTWGPRLQKYDLQFLREKVKEVGLRRAAEDLGVDKSTLWRYLKRRNG